jgi:hypothetical protein
MTGVFANFCNSATTFLKFTKDFCLPLWEASTMVTRIEPLGEVNVNNSVNNHGSPWPQARCSGLGVNSKLRRLLAVPAFEGQLRDP